MILCTECQIRKSHISKKELSDDIFLSSIHAHVNLLTFFNLEDSIFVKASQNRDFKGRHFRTEKFKGQNYSQQYVIVNL